MKDSEKREFIDRMIAAARASEGDWEVTHSMIDDAVEGVLRLLAYSPDDPANMEKAREVLRFLDETEDWTRWYA